MAILRYTQEASALLKESLTKLDFLLVNAEADGHEMEELQRRIAETAPILLEVSESLVDLHHQLDRANSRFAVFEEVISVILLKYLPAAEIELILVELRKALDEEAAG